MKPRVFWTDYQSRVKSSNEQSTAKFRERITSKQSAAEPKEETVTAKEFFVWTIEAEHQDRSGDIRAGKQVRAEHLYTAPKWMLDRGLIVDAAESPVAVQEGQSDLLEF